MNDAIEALAREEFGNSRPIADIQLDEAKSAARFEKAQPVELQRNVVVIVQVVEADDFVTPVKQAQRSGPANEAGGAGKQDFHISFPRQE